MTYMHSFEPHERLDDADLFASLPVGSSGRTSRCGRDPPRRPPPRAAGSAPEPAMLTAGHTASHRTPCHSSTQVCPWPLETQTHFTSFNQPH